MLRTEDLVARIGRDGCAVAPALIAPAEVAEIRASLAPWLNGAHLGRNDFEGFRSERVHALLAEAPPEGPTTP
jgi:hypothetical protein